MMNELISLCVSQNLLIAMLNCSSLYVKNSIDVLLFPPNLNVVICLSNEILHDMIQKFLRIAFPAIWS